MRLLIGVMAVTLVGGSSLGEIAIRYCSACLDAGDIAVPSIARRFNDAGLDRRS